MASAMTDEEAMVDFLALVINDHRQRQAMKVALTLLLALALCG
jgi:hypothetical protein